MTSQSVGGILGAIVAAIVLVAAFAFGPMGQFGKPRQAGGKPAGGAARSRRARAARAGDPGSAELDMTNPAVAPLRIAATIPI